MHQSIYLKEKGTTSLWFLRGASRIWTGDQGVADPRLTAWLSRPMTPTRFELVLPPWKGDVLTAWPWGLIYCLCILTHLQASVNRFSNLLKSSSPSRTRTYDNAVNSRALYLLSYRGIGIWRTFKTTYWTSSHFSLPFLSSHFRPSG